MSTENRLISEKTIVDDVLGRSMTLEIWTANYEKVLPISVQDFDLSAVLPAIFYMFRFGRRRGKGKFLEAFGGETGTIKERRLAATIDRVSNKLANSQFFDGFDDETTKAILGDMLLCFCLENNRRALGRQDQIQRATPSHYMASWIDLPESVVNLRFVPEMIVAMLADQKGDHVQADMEDGKSRFGIGRRAFDDNLLLQAFNQGVIQSEGIDGRHSDQFQETSEVGLDQLLMIRLAQQLSVAPDALRGRVGAQISNQRPVAERATQLFSDDIRRFVRSYSNVIPRHAFVEILGSCIAVGLTTIVTSVIDILFEWDRTGEIRKKSDQHPIPLFVDCSNGVDRGLRALAEQSMEDCVRQIERFPVIMMTLRLLDHGARYDRRLKRIEISVRPYATEWLNLLGGLLHDRHQEAQHVLDYFDRLAEQLADRLQEEGYSETATLLKDDRTQPNPVWRLAEALTSLKGLKNAQTEVNSLLNSTLMTGRPNGLAASRKVTRQSAGGGAARRRELRSLVFTDSVLDYLVHILLLSSGSKIEFKPLSLKSFIKTLREKYGFYVDQAPPGMTISNDLLRNNRTVLERRLRDLGLLTGVNDAEAMKRLNSRFDLRKKG